MRGHTIIFEKNDMSIFGAGLQDTSVPWYGATKKIDYMPISLAGPWGPSGPWHIKKLCHKKKFCVEVFFIPKGHFWEMHKEN